MKSEEAQGAQCSQDVLGSLLFHVPSADLVQACGIKVILYSVTPMSDYARLWGSSMGVARRRAGGS